MISPRITLAIVVSTLFLVPVQTLADSANIYLCDTDFSKSHSKGFRPDDVAFQIIDGAKKGRAVDPLNYHYGKIAKAKQTFAEDGSVTLAWRMQVPTTEGFQMGGNMKVVFDPATMTGTIRSHIPSRLVDGGTVIGNLSCKKVKGLPQKKS
ncbi:hypothetical protein TRL7639_02490 [Falsiruegeria litorea R37]|uniref:Uncharacterized protein n=1 Tax=Falsiruegeria litorea R37 TaxID=1200284 RepID=A0A1Y5SV56_9RHOB|nr:hypothetical protein [Falsiruegeria litorea]SLN45871.1 hypothetical protein TRL7639_02490 [Falsiruegeria litorea R37]